MACGNMNNTGLGFVLEFYFDGESVGQIKNRNLCRGSDRVVTQLFKLFVRYSAAFTER